MKIQTLLAPALALLPVVAAPAVAQDPPPAKGVAGWLTTDLLREELDVTLEWLKKQQDPKTGAYGDVQVTGLVLVALADPPWYLTVESGPHVSKAIDYLLARQRPDGAICEPNAGKLMARVQTNFAQDALQLYDHPVVKQALKRSYQFTERPTKQNAPWAEALATTPDQVMLTNAEDSLRNRHADGYWEGPQGNVRSTAIFVNRLGGYYSVLKSREAPPMMETAQRPLPPFDGQDFAKSAKALERGAAFLLSTAENGRWGFPGQPDPGITAMVTGALLTLPEPRPEETQKVIDGALDWLVSMQHEDGSIHAGQLKNYVTSASILALAKAGREKDKPAIAKARAFLRELQVDEGEGSSPSDKFYGGVGYGGDGRPDLSNLQMALEALNAAGLESGDETFQKALTFLQRCQNRSESNDIALTTEDGFAIKSGEDGGSAYAPGESKAGLIELSDGTRIPRSYGSMTYALLKAYLFAGLKKDDPRVEAAWKWLRANYTLDVNPGFEASKDPNAPYQGLYYYFYTMARALDLYGEEVVVDPSGKSHGWRKELVNRLVGMQRQDGSWINANAERWYEGNPVLASSYAMMTLEMATPDVQKR